MSNKLVKMNGAGLVCQICQGAVDPDSEHRVLKQLTDDALGPQETDPVAGHLHEVCALREEMQNLAIQSTQAKELLAVVVDKLGGAVRFHLSDIVRVKAQSSALHVEKSEDDFLTVELRRGLIVAPPRVI